MELRFAQALHDLQKLLLGTSHDIGIPIRFALVGGLAVAAWGVVRATEDIDFLADSVPSPLREPSLRARITESLARRGCKGVWRIGESDDPIPLLLRLEKGQPSRGPKADILWAHKRWQREALGQVVALKVGRMKAVVLHPEDLILMKLEAGGPQDLLDVEGLISSPPPELSLPRLRRKAAAARMLPMVAKFLARIRREKK